MAVGKPIPSASEKIDFDELREKMGARQIVGREIRNPHVLEAMRQVPRETFVPAELAEVA